MQTWLPCLVPNIPSSMTKKGLILSGGSLQCWGKQACLPPGWWLQMHLSSCTHSYLYWWVGGWWLVPRYKPHHSTLLSCSLSVSQEDRCGFLRSFPLLNLKVHLICIFLGYCRKQSVPGRRTETSWCRLHRCYWRQSGGFSNSFSLCRGENVIFIF